MVQMHSELWAQISEASPAPEPNISSGAGSTGVSYTEQLRGTHHPLPKDDTFWKEGVASIPEQAS